MDTARWLDARRPPPPALLRRAVDEVVARADPPAGALADRLAAAGLHALGRVVAAPSTRSRALELLAGDALLTYACEAAVEAEAEGEVNSVQRLVDGLDLRRFAVLLQAGAGE